MTALDWTKMPPKIAALPRDARGYPIPYIVLRDADGNAILGANDYVRVVKSIRDRLCHVCGQPLGKTVWLVGGPASALANGDHGAWGDGPLHDVCMRYAMAVCPYLAHRTVKPMAEITERRATEAGATMLPDIPGIGGMPVVFVAVAVRQWRVEGGPVFIAPKPYDDITYWQDGHQLRRLAGEIAARDAIKEIVT